MLHISLCSAIVTLLYYITVGDPILDLVPQYSVWVMSSSYCGAGRSSEVEHSLMVRWVVGSILHEMDPLSYFSFQPVLHDWCNKGCGMCYPVCGMVHIKEPLLLIAALNTFYLRLYGVRHMVKDHSDSDKGNPLPPHRLLFPINSKGSFICTIPQTG